MICGTSLSCRTKFFGDKWRKKLPESFFINYPGAMAMQLIYYAYILYSERATRAEQQLAGRPARRPNCRVGPRSSLYTVSLSMLQLIRIALSYMISAVLRPTHIEAWGVHGGARTRARRCATHALDR